MQRAFRFLLAFYAGSAVLLAQPYFFRQDIPAGPGILTVTTGDFNGDHRPDIAVNGGCRESISFSIRVVALSAKHSGP
jgi:hypothetical protein